jgi:translation initiation factor IF-1
VAGSDAITVAGVVIAALPHTLYRVELANGHRVLAHLTGAARQNGVSLALGTEVILEMSPFDLSKGRIRLEEK